MTPPAVTLQEWIEQEYLIAAREMRRAISPVDLVKQRPGFGQMLRAAKGAIVASPVLASYDPDPDYFFHWYRDSAVVIDGLRLLYVAGRAGPEAVGQFGDFLRFSLALEVLDGRRLVDAPAWRSAVAPDFVKFLRDDEDLGRAHGDAIPAETRVNPDGTLDISRWNRPQHDGPPLRALAVLRWVRAAAFEPAVADDVIALLRADLGFTTRHWQEPSFDIWEEEKGLHYYTLRVSAAALQEGAAWLDAIGDASLSAICRTEGESILRLLDSFWLEEAGHYRSRILDSGARSAKELDIAVILAAIHAEGQGLEHSVHDPRMQATLERLEALFDRLYPINHGRGTHRGPAMGRYEGDVYYSGGAYFFSTLGAAEFCYRVAAGAADARAWFERGEACLETVRAYTPANGELSEQFDQNTGAQTSARHLAWSYAAFISCVTMRRVAQELAGR